MHLTGGINQGSELFLLLWRKFANHLPNDLGTSLRT